MKGEKTDIMVISLSLIILLIGSYAHLGNADATPSLKESVDNPDLDFTTGGNASWFGQSEFFYADGDAAESGNISDDEESWLETAVVGPGRISFYWKVSSEMGDFLRFYIDGVEISNISGDIDWKKEIFYVESGIHTIRWKYEKDSWWDDGKDCGWLDKVAWTPGIKPVENLDKDIQYSEIQTAIDDANKDDTILVRNNLYSGSLTLNKSINMVGENKNETIIDGNGAEDIIYCNASVRISNFTIRNGSVGITIWKSNSNIITNNSIKEISENAVSVYGSCYNKISFNTVVKKSGYWWGDGIILKYSSDHNIIAHNDIRNIEKAISIEQSSHNNILDNYINNTDGIDISSSSYINLTNNKVENSSFDGIELSNSNRSLIYSNTIHNNDNDGVYLSNCNGIYIILNTIGNNKNCGIYSSSCYNNIVYQNQIDDNGQNGISLLYGGNNTVIKNKIAHNREKGINIDEGGYYGESDAIYYNSFINNGQNAYASQFHTWDNGYPYGGNYWDDYTGSDTNNDGIGDTPYAIPGDNNKDQYPLMSPWGEGNRSPLANFSWDLQFPTTVQTIQFNDSSIGIGSDIVNWTWDFGDGTVKYEQNPHHQYTTKGNYTVTLTVTDETGANHSRQRSITILNGSGQMDKPNWHEEDYWRYGINGTVGGTYNISGTMNVTVDGKETISIDGKEYTTRKVTLSENMTLNYWGLNYTVWKNTTKFYRESDMSLLKIKRNSSASEDKERIYHQPFVGFDWPITVGKEWERHTNATVINESEQTEKKIDFYYKCIGKTNIDTSAGNFTCYVLKAWEGKNNSEDYQLAYLSPETGYQSVLREYYNNSQPGREYKLTSFQYSIGAPTANFSYTVDSQNTTIYVDGTTSFDLDGEITNYSWDWTNDGIWDGYGAAANHTYPAIDTYTVKLQVKDNNGSSATAIKQIYVGNNPPSATFTIEPKPYYANTTLYFNSTSTDSDGTITSIYWEWGDGTVTHCSDPGPGIHTLTKPYSAGIYTVNLTVTDDDGVQNTSSKTITVETPPNNPPNTPSKPSGQSSGYTGTSYSYSTSATDSDGDQVKYYFDWDDGTGTWTTLQSSGQTASKSHTWSSIGTYNVRVKAQDEHGAESDWSTIKTVSIEEYVPPNQAPACSLSVDPTSGYVPLDVTFSLSASDSDGSISSWELDIDNDGSADFSGSGNPPATKSHTYQNVGEYTAKLTVTDNDGASNSDTATITVNEKPNQAPTASFDYTPPKPTANTTVNFTDGSTDTDGTIANCTWNFGDGTTGYGQTTNHTYTAPGTYNVTLTATDNDGDTDSYIKSVEIKAPSKDEDGTPGFGIALLVTAIAAILLIEHKRNRR